MIHIRQISPKALQYGILPQCAVRIQTLYLPILSHHKYSTDQNANHQKQQQQLKVILKSIVTWMDVLSNVFLNLKYIYIQPQESNKSKRDDTTSQNEAASNAFTLEEVQLLRTYVLYRLPTLLSMDGVDITPKERNDSKSLFLREKSWSTAQRSKSSPDIQRLNNGGNKPSYTHQARAKIFAGHQMRSNTSKYMPIQQPRKMKLVHTKSRTSASGGLEPMTSCLLDGMMDEDDDDDENVNENEKPDGALVQGTVTEDNVNRRIILVSDDAVEVKQQSPEKTKRPSSKPLFSKGITTNRRNHKQDPRLVPPATATTFHRQNRPGHHFDRRSLNVDPPNDLPYYNPSLSFEQNQHPEWEYVSASGESSIHAVNACAAWTTACGTLTSSLYNLRSSSSARNRSMNQPRQQNPDKPVFDTDTGNAGALHDIRMKTDRIKTKFHLLQQNRLKKNNATHKHYMESRHGEESNIASQPHSKDYEIGMLTLDEYHHQAPTDSILQLVPPSLSRHCNHDPLEPYAGKKEFTYLPASMPESSVDVSTAVMNTSVNATQNADLLQVKTAHAYTSKNCDKSFILTPQTPRGSATPTVALAKPSNGTKPSTNLFNIAIPYGLAHSRSSPTKLPSSLTSNHAMTVVTTMTKNELPPPCPGATRRPRPPDPMMMIRHNSIQNTMNGKIEYEAGNNCADETSRTSIPRCNNATKTGQAKWTESNTDQDAKGLIQSSFDCDDDSVDDTIILLDSM